MEDSEVLENNMYRCNICNKEFKACSTYCQHLSKNMDIAGHKEQLISLQQSKIDKVFKYIKVLDAYYKDGRPFVTIYNSKCKHTSNLRLDHIIGGRECSDKVCTSRNKSLGNLGKPKSNEHKRHIREAQQDKEFRRRMSITVRASLHDPVIRKRHLDGMYNARQKHAEGVARWQRKKMPEDERYCIGLLESNNIKYQHQVPFVTKDIEAIIDFYLPEYNTYLAINTDSFHKIDLDSTSENYLNVAHSVVDKDNKLKELFSNNPALGKLVQVYTISELKEFISTL